MSRAERAYLIGCAAVVGYALGYALPVYARLPRLFYDPIARSWHFTGGMGPIPMGYVGQVLWGALAALLAGGTAWGVASLIRQPLSNRATALWGAWTLTALCIMISYFTWNNWP